MKLTDRKRKDTKDNQYNSTCKHTKLDEDRSEKLQANLKTATKISAKVLHPCYNWKQNVSVALAIFHPSTSFD